MTPRTARARAWLSTIAFLCVVALVVVAGLAFAATRPLATKYAALMENAIGIYPNSDVRVLGVPVGRVTSITPQGQLVRLDFEVDHDVQIPADAKAVIVVPTVVADRYVQLTPAYNGGPTLAAGTVIGRDRTAVPAEFDDLLASVQKLSTALGPRGVNQTGALSDALHTLAQNLNGNGELLNTSLGNTAQAINTLAASRQNLFGTVQNLQSFTTNLKDNDAQVRAFTYQFAQVSGYLASERKELAAALRELSIALGEVAKFIRDNRQELRTDVGRLADILKTVNGERLALEQALDTAQSGLDGLVNGYNASAGTLDARTNLLASLLCSVLGALQSALPADLLTTVLPAFIAIVEAAFPGQNPLAGCVSSSSTVVASATQQLSSLLVPAPAGAAPATASPPPPNQQRPHRSGKQGSGKREPNQPSGQPPRPGLPSLGSLVGGGQ